MRTVWTYYVSRNSVAGDLSGVCDLWYVKPTRVRHRYRVTWVSTDHQNPGHLGEGTLDDVHAWFRVVPDSDLQLIRVEQYATPKMLEAAARVAK